MVVGIIVVGFAALFGAIPFMMGSSVVHDYWPEVPAFSFWESFWVVWGFGVLWSRVNFGKESK